MNRLKRLDSLFFCPLYCAVFFFCLETFSGASLVAEDETDKRLFYAQFISHVTHAILYVLC